MPTSQKEEKYLKNRVSSYANSYDYLKAEQPYPFLQKAFMCLRLELIYRLIENFQILHGGRQYFEVYCYEDFNLSHNKASRFRQSSGIKNVSFE